MSDFYYGLRKMRVKHEEKPSKKRKVDYSDSEKDDLEGAIEGLLSVGSAKTDLKIEREYNHIYFYSEVTRNSTYQLCKLIKEAEEENIFTSYKLNIDQIPIYIHISSFGGSIFAAFTAIDVIQNCKVPVYSIIEGATASAGTLISIVAKKRYITSNSFMLIHQLSSSCWGKMSEIEDEFSNLQELMEKIKDFYKEFTSIPKKELNDLLKHDLWLNANKCIKHKLVDEIWNK